MPTQQVVEVKMNDLKQKAKRKSTRRQASDQDESDRSSENSEEERNRDRAATFLMSIAEKRAYELKKRLEKEFNERFKVLFIEIVRQHLTAQARIMKVIDMTNVEAFNSLRSGPIKRASSLIGIKHKVKVDSLDLH